MSSQSSTVEAVVRGRFVAIPGARARRIAANAWSVQVPRTDEVKKVLRVRAVDLDSLEGLEIAIDQNEAYQVVPSAETADHVELSVLL